MLEGHQEPPKPLERRSDQSLWYAIALRGYGSSGGTADIVFIRYPYRDPEYHREFLSVLATAAGNPPAHPDPDYSRAIVHRLPARLSLQEFLEGIQASPSGNSAPPGSDR